MSKKELVAMIETMNNYDDLAAKAKAKADAYILRYTSIISNRFDSTTFKKLYADLYHDFTKPVSSRRFTVSC